MKKQALLVVALLLVCLAAGCSVSSVGHRLATVGDGSGSGTLSGPSRGLPQSAAPEELLAHARELLDDDEYEEAIKYFSLVLDANPASIPALIGRGDAYVRWEERLDLAQSDYEAALDLDSRSNEAFLGLIDVYIRRADYDRALDLATSAYRRTDYETLRRKIEELETGNITDSQGRSRRITGYDPDGSRIWHIDISFERNRESRATGYDGAGALVGHVDVLYDQAGRVIQSHIDFETDGLIGFVTYEYNADGDLSRDNRYFLSGTLANYGTYEYNELRQLVKITHHGANGEVVQYAIHEYDINGIMGETTVFSPDDKIISYALHDEDGRATEKKIFNLDGTLFLHTTYEYDEKGDLAAIITFDADGNEINRVVYSGY